MRPGKVVRILRTLRPKLRSLINSEEGIEYPTPRNFWEFGNFLRRIAVPESCACGS
jgi:hypothetical protein